jgi:hypothetical protein
MRSQKSTVLGHDAPPPRLTMQALTLIACALSVPAALILWGIEAIVR